MRKGKDLIGMPVVVTSSRVEIERVEGLVLDLSETHISALLVDCDDFSRQARILPLHDVQSFGENEIAVGSASVIHAVDQIPDIRRILNMNAARAGAHLVANDGTDVGTVNDILFDEETGDIDSFEVSSNTLSDSRVRSEPLPLFDELDDEIIVQASNVRQLAETQALRRLKAANAATMNRGPRVNSEPHAAQATMTTSKPATIDRVYNLSPWVGRIWSFAREHWNWITLESHKLFKHAIHTGEERRIEQVLGHRISSTIFTGDGKVKFEKGDIITPAVIEHARQTNLLSQLLNTSDRSPVQAALTKEEERTRGWLDDWWPPYI